MNEIKCPNCGTVFAVDETGYADLVKQVRDAEFSRELHEREELMAREREAAVKLARQEVVGKAREEAAAQEARIAELTAKLEASAARWSWRGNRRALKSANVRRSSAQSLNARWRSCCRARPARGGADGGGAARARHPYGQIARAGAGLRACSGACGGPDARRAR